MKSFCITIAIFLLSYGWSKAQDCECYAPTRQTAVRMMEKKDYAKALKLLRAAEKCPDKPDDNDLADKIGECRRAIKMEQDRIETERNKPATPPNDDNSAGEIVIPLVPRQEGGSRSGSGGSGNSTGSGRNGTNRGRDLSARGTANCYVVSSPGTYSFPTVKGNSSASVGKVVTAEVLWETFGTSDTPSKGDIIKSVSNTESSGTITFSTPSRLRNGNALIAAKDAYGTILWSWHIWVCKGYDPVATAQVYYNNAGTMMDRNLGATSAIPGDVGALGLLYQWGRKDPFLGSSFIFLPNKAASTLTWPSAVASNSSNGTIEYAVKHPTTFITARSSSNKDWVYSSRDNKLWQTSKTIYDPCPPGWKVPSGGASGVWSKAVGSDSKFSYTWDSTNYGMNFSGKFGSASTIWYPAAGFLYGGGDGSLCVAGGFSYWWSCTPYDYYAYYLYLDFNGYVNPSENLYRADGLSVRCLQE